jgi:leader peptidase (prepilin peptidase)/N-methyltransferase
MPVSQPAALALAFVLGAVLGSFLNVCIVRWPEGLSVVRPPSRCPRCGRGVRWYENVPIVSWLALRGRCAGCGQPISVVYPVVELLVALGWMACVAAFGPTVEALRVAVFGTVLLGIAATDARHYVIPDGFTLFLLGWQLLVAFVVWFIPTVGESSHFAGPYEAIVGACTGAGAIAILRWLGERAFGREAMGEGDVTMMAGVGAALGAERAGLTVLVAAFIGAIVAAVVVVPARLLLSRRQAAVGGAPLPGREGISQNMDGARDLTEIPFGVFLAPAALFTLLWGDRLIAWYFTRILNP